MSHLLRADATFYRKVGNMKYILIDKATKAAEIYTSKTDLGQRIGVCRKTIFRWQKEGIKEYKDFIIGYDALEIKATGKIRSKNNNF